MPSDPRAPAKSPNQNPEGITGEQETRRCPRCRKPYKNLPVHLRACDGGEAGVE